MSYYAQWPWRPRDTPRRPLLRAAVAYPLHKLVLIVRFIHLIEIGDLKGTQFLVISSTSRKYIFKFRPKFEYNLFTSRHFTPLRFASRFFCLHFTPLCATSLCLPSLFPTSLRISSRFSILISPHFAPLPLTTCFVCLTSRHFASPPVLFASLHLTSCRFTPIHSTLLHLPFFSQHLTSPRLTSFHLTSPHLISYDRPPARFTSQATLHQKSAASSVNA